MASHYKQKRFSKSAGGVTISSEINSVATDHTVFGAPVQESLQQPQPAPKLETGESSPTEGSSTSETDEEDLTTAALLIPPPHTSSACPLKSIKSLNSDVPPRTTNEGGQIQNSTNQQPDCGNPILGTGGIQVDESTQLIGSDPQDGVTGYRRCLEKFCCPVIILTILFGLVFTVSAIGLISEKTSLSYTGTPSIYSNNTIPLVTPQHHSIPELWFTTLTVSILKPTVPVEVLYANGDSICTTNHKKSKLFDSASIPIRTDSIIEVIVWQYLIPGSVLHLNFTITDLEYPKNDGAVTLCIINNRYEYDKFKENNGDLHACKDLERFTYSISKGANYSLNYTFLESGYFFLIFLSNRPLKLQYSNNLTYYYYELTDYKSSTKCTISENSDWQSCSFDISNTWGCFLVYAAPSVSSPTITDMTVKFFYDPFYTLFIGSAFFFFVGVVLFFVACFLNKRKGWKFFPFSECNS